MTDPLPPADTPGGTAAAVAVVAAGLTLAVAAMLVLRRAVPARRAGRR